MSSLHQNIKKRRQELHLSQEELAKRVGYTSRSSINKIELGKCGLSISKIIELAHALDTTPAHLLEWDRPKEEEMQDIVIINRGGNTIRYKLPKKKLEQFKTLMDTFYQDYLEDSQGI